MTTEAEEVVDAAIYSVIGVALGVFCLLVASAIVMLAWNWSMPHLFALPEASYRNAFGLTMLAWALRLCSARFSKEG